MFDPNIIRWMFTSITQHVKDLVPNYPLYLDSYTGENVWGEIRFDGPNIENYEYASFKFDVTVDILVTCFCGTDEYLIYTVVGAFATALDNDICLFKYGDGPEDDQSQFGTLQMYPSKDRRVNIMHFGFITPDSKMKRSSAEASYTLWL
jgi:hypothetical protein